MTHSSPSMSLAKDYSQMHPETLLTSRMRLSTLRTELDGALAGHRQDLDETSYTAVKVLLPNWESQDLGQSIFAETAELGSLSGSL